ncbi:MAG: hypothetical protein ACFFG0_18400 [Candidatus Thorarchaeota archaeon]
MEKRKTILLLLSLTVMLNANIVLCGTIANPIPVPMDYYMGSIFTNSTSFNLINADVVFDIDSTDFENNIGISFEGNYTIFNPNNATELMIVAPFSVSELVINSNCTVEVNDSQILFEIGDSWDLGIDDFISNYTAGWSWIFIACNITIPENASQTIKYKFNGLMPNPLNPYRRNDQLSILYDLETSKAWSGNISERVEFRVHGKLPNRIDERTEWGYETENRLITTNIANGKIYSWEWNNEQINTQQVGIIYEGELLTRQQKIIIGVSVGIGVPIVIVAIVFGVRKKKRSKMNE